LFLTLNDELLMDTDGTIGGVAIVSKGQAGLDFSEPQSFAVSNGSLFFSASSPDFGFELYRTTTIAPPPTATHVISDFISSGNNSDEQFSQFTELNGQALFLVDGFHLWTSNGTASGTNFVTSVPISSPLMAVHGAVLFTELGNQLWKSDGTAAGTTLVKDFDQLGD